MQAFIKGWNAKWCESQLDPQHRWRFKLLSLQSSLVGIIRLSKARVAAGLTGQEGQAGLYGHAREILSGALALPDALHMLRPTSNLVFAATIVWQRSESDSPDRDLVLRLGLRLAGPPGEGQLMLFARHNGLQILNMLWWVATPLCRGMQLIS